MRTHKAEVVFDELGVTSCWPDGTAQDIRWDELTAVDLVTTDVGPFLDDVFWVLRGEDRECVVPNGVEGCQELMQRLQELPGFNSQAVIDAMCCTSNARFFAWQQ